MGLNLCILATTWITAQGYDQPQPPSQGLWTCSSRLGWRNVMDCHTVGDVSLPFLDCSARFWDRLLPRYRSKNQVRYQGVKFTTPDLAGLAGDFPQYPGNSETVEIVSEHQELGTAEPPLPNPGP